MSIESQVQLFKSLGFSGKDLRHVGVSVEPCVEVRDGALVQTHKIYVGGAIADFSVDFPTEFVLVSVNTNWAFDSFELDGQTWPGIAVFPTDGDFEVRFGDKDQLSVVLYDGCKCFYAHRYQVVMRHRKTGEATATDPSVQNIDRQKVRP